MFTHTSSSFGNFTQHRLQSNDGKTSLSCVPEYGGILLDLTLDGQSLLDAYQTPEELQANRWYKNTLLYPFPNRLNHGEFHWAGKIYQFPINEPSTNTALHGLGATKQMTIRLNSEGNGLICHYQHPASDPYFPFPFSFEVEYRLEGKNQFIGIFRVQNQASEAIPMGLGWHPYFQLNEDIAHLKLQFPTAELVGVDSRMLPSGKKYAYTDFSTSKAIGPTILDNCFYLNGSGQENVLLTSTSGTMRYWQDASRFPFMQVFTPPFRSAIAIEPMSCNIDALNTGDGLLRLEIGASWEGSFGIEWQKKDA